MKYIIPAANWTMKLADAIDEASDGDVIVVRSDAMKELGEDALKRMCPDKTLVFEVQEPTLEDW